MGYAVVAKNPRSRRAHLLPIKGNFVTRRHTVVTPGELDSSSVAEFLSSGAMSRARAGGLVRFVYNDTDWSHTWGNFQYTGGRDRGWTERLHSLARLLEDDGIAVDALKRILKKASLSKGGMRGVLRKTPQPEAA